MSRTAIVLRPEPGNSTTAARLRAAGLAVVQMPLFAVEPLGWSLPEGQFDALLLTSANAVRHGGAGLAALAALPVIAVGAATAVMARAAGLTVVAQGDGDAAAAIALAHRLGFARLLHLAGLDRAATGSDVVSLPVYAACTLAIEPAAMSVCIDSVSLLHSARAAAHFADRVAAAALDRTTIRLAAISPAVLAAADEGWGCSRAANVPRDEELVALARALAD